MSAAPSEAKQLHAFYGADDFSAREALSELRMALGLDAGPAGELRLEGRGLTVEELANACQAKSFFAANQLVVVQGLLQRLSGAQSRRRGRRTRGPGTADADDASEVAPNPFVATLLSLPAGTHVVLLDQSVSRQILDVLRPNAEVREFRYLSRRDMPAWVRRRAQATSVQLTSAAAERLVALFDGEHLGQLAQEIEKLATYAPDRPVDVADIEAVVTGAISFRFYDITDAMIDGQPERALKALRSMDERDRPPALVLATIVGAYRQLLLAQALLREGLSAQEIGQRLRIPQTSGDYVLNKVIGQASGFPAARLEAAYRRIFEADVAVKTGALDGDTALELLITELALLPGARRRVAARR